MIVREANPMGEASRAGLTVDLGAMLRALAAARRPIVVGATAIALIAAVAASPLVGGHRAVARLALPMPATGLPASADDAAAVLAGETSRLASTDFAARVLARPGLDPAVLVAPAGLDPIARIEDLVLGAPTGARAGRRFLSRLGVTAERPFVGENGAAQSRPVVTVAWSGPTEEAARTAVAAIVAEYVADAPVAASDPAGAMAAVRRELAEVEAKRDHAAEAAAAARRGAEDLARRIEAERAERIRLDARVPVLARLAQNGSDLPVAAELTDSPVLRRLREQRTEVTARLAALGDTYLSDHPLMKSARAESTDLERRIRAEATRLLAQTRTDLAALGPRIDRMVARADDTGTDPIVTGSIATASAVDPAGFDARIGELRRRLADLLERATSAATDRPAVLSAATIGDRDLLASLGFGLKAALLVVLAGTVLVLVRAVSAGALRRPEEDLALWPAGSIRDLGHRLETAYPPPASAPDDEATVCAAAEEPPIAAEVAEPAEPIAPARRGAEPFHRVWTEVVERRPPVARIVVVAPEDAGCAHRTAQSLLSAAAIAGETACRIDLAGSLDAERAVGLADLLAGTAGYGEVIVLDRFSRGHLIGPGSRGLGPEERRGVDLERVLSALERVYDRVILDFGCDAEAAVDLVEQSDAVVLAVDSAMPDAEIERLRVDLTAVGAPLVLAAAAGVADLLGTDMRAA
jgi:hypothetical protein